MMTQKMFNILIILPLLFGCGGSSDSDLSSTGTSSGQDSTMALTVDSTIPISRNNRVIYEMNLYDFTSQGTLAAATAKIQSLKKLGIDIIWVMPIHQRGIIGKVGSLGSPYAPKDYYSVNSDFGTLDDFKTFVSTAHDYGIEVWLDWVPDHTSMDATWITEHPEYYLTENGQFVHPSNYSDVYQLNMESTDTQNAMIAAMEYWIDQADIDGFRCDYVSSPQIPAVFWKRAIPLLKSHKTGKTITVMGEADFTDQTRLYNCGFDFDYAWAFNTNLRDIGSTANAITLKADCNSLVSNSNYTTLDRMVYLTNHDDTDNSMNYISYMGNNTYPFTVLEFTLYGMPLLYNGQEIYYTKLMNIFERDPIDWYNNINVKMQNTIRTLIALKHTQKALANGASAERGSVTFLNTDKNSVLAYIRKKDDNEVLIVLNLGSATTVKVSGITAGKYTQWINSSTIAKNISSKSINLSDDSSIYLDNNGYVVYVLH